jgi:hypothetical protein
MMPTLRRAAGAVLAMLVTVAGAHAQVAMPDPSQIHGKALPASDLASGVVTVRVVRESVGNNLPGQTVRVTSGATTSEALTDAQGRAEFTDLPKGQQAVAAVTVDGEVLTSEPFAVPTSGGLRVILIAGIAQAAERRSAEEAASAAAPPVKGVVVLGANSRILMEFQDDTLQVFYLLEVINNARARVDIGGPLVIDLPTGAGAAATLEGSTQQATVSGDRVTITGPFASGVTPVQLGFSLRNVGSDYQLRQTFPVTLEQVTVALERAGTSSMSSSQFKSTGDVKSESGTTFMLGSGPTLAAGSTLVVDLTGLPAHSSVPGYAALAVAGSVMRWGAWLAFRRPDTTMSRQALIARRDTLLGDLAQLEQRRRAGQDSPKDAARRIRVLAELEQLYAELDQAGAGPRGGGEGVAA